MNRINSSLLINDFQSNFDFLPLIQCKIKSHFHKYGCTIFKGLIQRNFLFYLSFLHPQNIIPSQKSIEKQFKVEKQTSSGTNTLQPIYNGRGWSDWPHWYPLPCNSVGSCMKARVQEARGSSKLKLNSLELESTGACTYKNLQRESIGVSWKPQVFSKLVRKAGEGGHSIHPAN